MDDISKKVEQWWDLEVEAREGYTVPCLDLTRGMVERYASGEADPRCRRIADRRFLVGIEGKSILCLASGGGQQSVGFGLLGAHVTVLDLCEGQLMGDRIAAERYGYQAETIKGDMRDLSMFADESFDFVYQPISICFVPDVRVVYREVYRVLSPGGLYAVSHCNPATYPACFDGGRNGWDGVGYRISERYKGGPILKTADGVETMDVGEPTGEHRHLLGDIFGGLAEAGFVVRDVFEDERHFADPKDFEPGSHEHNLSIIAEYFSVVCTKPRA